jgi:hypothetical protein
MVKKIGLVLVLAALSSVASAGGSGSSGFSCTTDYLNWFGIKIPYEVCTSNGGGSAAAAPEIDSASGVAGLTLVLGGLAVLRSRRSKASFK